MNKLDMESKNNIDFNISRIADLFPNVVKENNGKHEIDFDALKQELSEQIIDEKKEKYQLTWPGKKEAVLLANKVSRDTLRPMINQSVNFADAKNLYIEGDNLDVLMILQESYLNKIKCIYIDPPYNTGSDFIYNDDYSKSTSDELLESGQIDEMGNRLVTNTESNGKFHSDWLTMMYPRLKIARNLLKKDGLLFVSIDDNELTNCIKLLEEIYGESNVINVISLKTNETKGLKNSGVEKKFPKNKEYLIIACKDRNEYKFNINKIQKDDDELRSYVRYYNKYIPNIEEDVSKWKIEDFKPLCNGKNDEEILQLKKQYADKLIYPVTPDNEIKYDMNDGEFKKVVNSKGNEAVYYKENGKIYNLLFLKANSEKNLGDLWVDISTININKETYGMPTYYNGQKPIKLLERILKYATNPNDNDIVMDFFAGSSTTADAVIRLNCEDGGNRKFISVQIGEDLNENLKKVTNQDTKKKIKILIDFFKENNLEENLKEYGKERIRRAISENNLNIGFRVFKVDTSNMKDDFFKIPGELEQSQLRLFETNIKEDRSANDLLSGVVLDLGLTLDYSVEEKNINNNKVFFVNDNELVACFDETVDINIIDEISEVEPLMAVFRDDSFKTDSDKINLEERFKKLSPNTKISIL